MADNFETEKNFSRRGFLKMSGVATGSLVAGTYLGSLITPDETDESVDTASEDPGQTSGGETSGEDFTRALKFFQTQDEFETLEAAAERIFPEDDNGPGAIGLGIGFFIDHQLAGGYGVNDKEYREGPFKEGTEFQGPQYRMNRREVFTEGVKALNKEAEEHNVNFFHELDAEQQDEILQSMQDGDVEMFGVPSSHFFNELRLATFAGAYADPMYGGNYNMEGWRMKNFTGGHMSFINEIEQEGLAEIEPQPLKSHMSHDLSN